MTKQEDLLSITRMLKLGYMPPPTLLTLASPYTHGNNKNYASLTGMSFTLAPNEIWDISVLLIFIADVNGYKFRFFGENIDVFEPYPALTGGWPASRSPVAFEYQWEPLDVLPLIQNQVSELIKVTARVYTGSASQSLRLQAARLDDTVPGGSWQITSAQLVAQRIA